MGSLDWASCCDCRWRYSLPATATLESSTTSGGENTASDIKGLSAELKKLRACLPEIQNEINGLSVEVEGTYAFIENNSQVSSYCQPVVYPEAMPVRNRHLPHPGVAKIGCAAYPGR